MILPVAGARATWGWLRHELALRWRAGVLALLVGLVGAAAAVVPAYALGLLVDRVREGAPGSVLAPIAVAIGVAAVVAGAGAGLASYLIARLGGQILAGLRERTVARALMLPSTTVERAGRGDLLSRVGADVSAISAAVTDVIGPMISSFLLAALSLVAMAGLDWRLGLAGAVAAPLYVAAQWWYLPRAAPEYARQRRAVAESAQRFVESTQGVRTIHAYRLERRHLDGIGAASAASRDVSLAVFRLFTRFVGRVNRAEVVGLTTILVAGFLLVRNGSVTVGATATAAVLFHRLFNPLSQLMFTIDEVQAAAASLARLVGVLTMPLVPSPAAPAGGEVRLSGVTFGYEGGPDVLHDVSLRVEPGERVALVGATGAGKSTLAAVAAGSLTPRTGTVAPGDVAIVTQETHVFAGPLVEDLRLARADAATVTIEAALSTVGALDWVRALPAGLDTVVGEGGHELSAAQAQQLALARLVLVDPAIAILDEATAEAGSLGARILEESAAAATRRRTTLIVAHRLTQAAAADRVVVLDGGRVVEEGTHDELVRAGGGYARLWRAWLARAVPSTTTTGGA